MHLRGKSAVLHLVSHSTFMKNASASPASPHPLKFGFSSLGCPSFDLPEIRKLAAKFGQRFIEIRTINGSLDPAAELAAFPGGPAGAAGFLAEGGVQTIIVGSSFQLAKSPADARAGLETLAETAEKLGAPWLRVFGGGDWGDDFTDDLAETARAHREWWRELRASRGWQVDLIFELHDAFSGTPQIEALFARTGGPMALLWDAHHTWKLAGEDPNFTWEKLAEHIRHVHLKDSVSQPSDGQGYTYKHPGTGEFPTKQTLDLLAADAFTGVVSLEWEKQWHPTLDPLDEVLPAWVSVGAPYRMSHAAPAETAPKLVLRCNFNHVTLVPAAGPYFHGPAEQYLDMPGTEFPNNAPDATPHLGQFRVYFEGGTESQRTATITSDADKPDEKFLRFRITEPNSVIEWPTGPQRKSRIQTEVYGNRGLTEVYETVRLRFHPGMAALRECPQPFHWFTLFEIWNQSFWTDEPFPFRISIGIAKPTGETGDLYFHADANVPAGNNTFDKIWVETSTLPVPFGEWMTLELYYREGNAETGRCWFAVTQDGGRRTVLFDVHDYTHHPENAEPSGMKQFNPIKCYTSDWVVDFLKSRGQAAELDWDDLELWTNRQPD